MSTTKYDWKYTASQILFYFLAPAVYFFVFGAFGSNLVSAGAFEVGIPAAFVGAIAGGYYALGLEDKEFSPDKPEK